MNKCPFCGEGVPLSKWGHHSQWCKERAKAMGLDQTLTVTLSSKDQDLQLVGVGQNENNKAETITLPDPDPESKIPTTIPGPNHPGLTPGADKHLREAGWGNYIPIDLKGSGKDGMITVKDVKRFLSELDSVPDEVQD